ncbi:MAG TPA: alkyl sulfatase dimerization domain-containing protein [Methanothrix sp.]|nr:alkyl sulfatase dimerization domain-containing protein [Methanothrix sp.]
MKGSTYLVLLLVAFASLSASSTAFEPNSVATNPKLANFTEAFYPPQVLNVTDGVYVARGYNRDNPVLIEGDDGLIIVDPGESITAAEIVKKAFNDTLDNIFDKKPVKAIIYTHHHDCHIHGASVFAGNNSPEIIVSENFNKTLYADWFGQLFPNRAIGGAMMGGILFGRDPGYDSGGALFAVQWPGPSGYMPPTIVVKDSLDINISDVHLNIFTVPGETRDVLVVWLPEKKLMVQIANFYEAFPAITTLRGAYPRNPLDYIDSIDFYRTFNAEYLVLCHGPHPVLKGEENISRELTNYRDAIQFVHDQTVQYMNKGLTPGEIKDLVKLPAHLADDPYLQQLYGQVDRDIYEIFWWYRGYFTGKCRDLYMHSPQDEAEMAAELAGGVDKLADKARQALDEGKAEWALELADDVLILDARNAAARETKNQSLITLAEKTFNAQERNYLLSEYLVETGQVKMQPRGFAAIDDRFVPFMPMNDLLRIMAVRLNATKSLDKDMTVALSLTDLKNSSEPSDYSLHVRMGILEALPGPADNKELALTTDSLTWKTLGLAKLDPHEAVETGKVTITGGEPEAFYEFMDLFNQ